MPVELKALFVILWSVCCVFGKDLDVVYPPCALNPLCTCSKGVPDLGIVQCRNVPFPAIPRMVNTSKVFMLHMENNELHHIEPYFFQATGLYELSISSNPISEIPDDAFIGLERSLWELHLTDNQLAEVPTRAIRHLQKLRTLDLSMNQISYVDHESWRGLEDSLEQLILCDNSLSHLPMDTFAGLHFLQTLDLSGNNLRDIDGSVFRDGMDKLTRVLLSNNLLTRIPYGQVSTLRSLKQLDLSHNRISTMNLADNEYNPGIRLSLDVLHLEYNNLEILQTGSFQFFDVVNQTFLDGNPLQFINDDAFRQAKIRELYLRQCNLDFISPSAFGGLENSLQILDMSGNNLSSMPEILFQQLFSLKSLGLRENRIKSIIPIEMFNGFQSTLLKLDLSGDTNAVTSFQDLKRMRNIRSLAVSKLAKRDLGPEDFLDFSPELENLKISGANLKSLKSHTFKYVRGIKRLDLSDNAISTLDVDAFLEIGHALQSLKLSHTFSASFTSLPRDVLKYLTSLRELDISNNQLKSISDTTFHFLRKLLHLNVQDNQIEQIVKGTFQGDIHSHLESILMGYNSVKYIPQHSFVDLERVRSIVLSDNLIEKIERRAFMNLHQLRVLNLRGNKLTSISDEAFQNLPETELIDLSYNHLNAFDFEFCDQVGTLSTLTVNVSHNKIQYLFDNRTFYMNPGREYGSLFHSNIKILDLSSNNITDINGGYFRPVEISLTHLYMSKNNMMNTTRSVFGNLQHLHFLDLSYNQIIDLDYDTFRNTRKLQYIDMSHNRVADLPTEFFKYITELRVVNLAHNYIRSLPENLFFDDGLEKLDLSHNWLIKIPVNAMSNVAAITLSFLDLSYNQIGTIHNVDLSTKFRSLSYLDLSNNHIFRLDDGAFAALPRLNTLILSNNEGLDITGRVFVGLENSLMDLRIENVSMMAFPDLPFTFLRRLSIAHNELPSIPPELAYNISFLRHLDLSYNDLSAVPLITHSLPQLKSLNLAGNPISTLTNTSLIGAAETLEVLNIAHLFLNSFELGALSKLSSLKTLIISPYPDVINFNIPVAIEEVETLRQLEIEAPKPIPAAYAGDVGFMRPKTNPKTDLKLEMDGIMHPRLRTIVLRGTGFKQVANSILNGIQSPVLHFILQNTSITSLPNNFFKSHGSIRNLTMDFTENNDNLIKLPNPNTGRAPHLPDQVFLLDLKLGNQQLSCDCGIGWIEYWSRKKRQYMCNALSWSSDVFDAASTAHRLDGKTSAAEVCANENGIREAECSNKGSQSLMEVLKSDLECGWDSAPRVNGQLILVFSIMTVFFLFWF
ncbi:chaoptin [Phlebotomus argentipes]|uniref:chaoptin n=1 Tax=Phlebotomus argentipes TaxID=94469 RepID=UPI002892E039|nr:chaoptin [Phlebotomus argentipes]